LPTNQSVKTCLPASLYGNLTTLTFEVVSIRTMCWTWDVILKELLSVLSFTLQALSLTRQ